MLHSTKSKHFSYKYYFFIIDETASRAVVWRPCVRCCSDATKQKKTICGV